METRPTLISPDDLSFVGHDLHRPECVLCGPGGRIWVSDWRGGVTRIDPDGSQHAILAPDAAALRPNGIAIRPDGSYLLANLGDAGGVWQLTSDGRCEPFLLEVEGRRLPPSNFVLVDAAGRTWITVSTRLEPRALGYRPDADDGFIVLVEGGTARVVADGLGYTNELAVDPGGEWLYVNETFGRRLSRFPLRGGTLGPRQTVTRFGAGTFPDGLCFDVDGGIWITSPVSNRLLRIAPDRSIAVILEDSDPEHVAWVEQAFLSGTMDRPHLDTIRSSRLRSISCLAFGGDDRRTAHLGCLLGDRVGTFRSPVAGVAPAHWLWARES